jgi:chromosome segregation ATPase
MEQARIAKQMIDFQRTTFDTSFNAMAMLQEQTEKMLNTSLEQTFWVPEEGRKIISECLESYKKGRENFKMAVDENFRKIDSGDEGAKEMEEKISKVDEDINLMGSRLAALEKRDWPQEVVTALLKKKILTAKEDLEPLKKALNQIEKGMPAASELGKIKKSVDQTETRLNGLIEEIAKVKEVLQNLGPKLNSLSTTSEKRVKDTRPGKSSETA